MNLKDVIRKVMQREVKPPEGEVWVTEVCGCLRRAWYKRRYGEEITKDMIVGIKGHNILLPKLAEELGCTYEVRIEIPVDSYILVGKADLVCEDRVIELKLSNSLHIRDEWITQANTYAVALGKDKFTIAIIGNSIITKDYPANKALFKIVLETAKIYIKHIKANKPPPPMYGDWCKYCPYRKECNKEKSITEYMR
ncbi:hypothetical protein J7J18_06155 [bacterium]|nr:hypothetical protein [bacterium]